MCQLHNNSRKDPTNTTRIRAQAIKELKRRRDGAGNELARFTQSLERYATRQVIEDGQVVNRVVYRYELDPTLSVDRAIKRIINTWFMTGSENKPPRFFMDEYISAAYNQGANVELERISLLAGQSLDEITRMQVKQILTGSGYSARIGALAQRCFEDMVDFSGDAGAPLRHYLTQAMAEGKGIRSITAGMKKLWPEQADYRLERIARSEIAHAHREARHDADKDARDRLGLSIKSQWISQLSPTTRPSHAALHLQVMEIEDVAVKYSEIQGGEINCLCLQQSVVITKDGEILGERKKTKADEAAVAFIMSKG